MAAEARKQEECGDACVIDLSKVRRQAAAEPTDNTRATLIILSQGTYGHHDDGFSAIQVGNALLAEEEQATLLLLNDGVYFVVKEQNSAAIGLPNNLKYIEDFIDLGGRILAVESALSRRGLNRDDLVSGVEVVSFAQAIREIENHAASVSF